MIRYQEEVLADLYAGRNRTARRGGTLDEMQQTVQREAAGAKAVTPDGERLAMGRTTDNRPFVEVEDDILAGVPKEDWGDHVKSELKKRFPDGITVGNNKIVVDWQSRKEMTFSKYTQWLYNNDPQMHADKLRATNNSDEILLATTGWVNEGKHHPRKDKIEDFARGSLLLRIGNNDYDADVIVAKRENGTMLLYDIVDMAPTSFTAKETNAAISANPSPGAARSTASVSMNSISGNSQNSNTSGNNNSTERFAMAGENARTADLDALRRAKEMAAEDVSAETILQETGWYQGRDGKWRFEIDDSGMEYRRGGAGSKGTSPAASGGVMPDGDANLMQEEGYRRLQELTEKFDNLTEAERAEYDRLAAEYEERVYEEKFELGDFLKHDALFEAYPSLRHVALQFGDLPDGVRGRFNKRDNSLTLSRELIGAPEATLLHEIQHVIQKSEGFAGGSSPSYWNERLEDGFDSRPADVQREGARLQEQYEQMRKEDPQFIQDMEELDAMTPDVPRGKVDFDTLEQLEPDPPEWVRFDERRDQLEAQYGDRVWDYFSLRDDIDSNAKKGSRGAMELYYNTAGEIEARDVAARKDLTAEERRNRMPELGDENTVFADSGVGYSIGEIVDGAGNSYGTGVHLDSTLLDNLTDRERVKMVQERVKELGGQHFTAYDKNGNAVDVRIAKHNERFVNKNGKRVPVNNDLTTKRSKSEVKQESVVLADEMIATANYDKDTAARYPHGWLDNNGKNNWEQWTTYVQDKQNTVWEATLHIATTANGEKILYDIDPIKKAGQPGKSGTSTATPSIHNTPQKSNPLVATKSSIKEDTTAKTLKRLEQENERPRGRVEGYRLRPIRRE